MFRSSIVIALCLVACSKQHDDAPPAPPPSPPKAPVRVDAGFAVWPATLEDRSITLEWHALRATLTGRVPVGWIPGTPGYFSPPDGGNPRPMDPSISWRFGNISCSGECDDGDMQKSMATSWKSIENGYARVSYNVGETDKLRLDVTVLEEGKFPDGKYKAVRVTRGANAVGAPEYLERVEATCVRHRKGDRYYIIASTSMKLVYEKTLWPLMLEACKTPWFRS